MAENRFAHDDAPSPEAATDGPASPFNPARDGAQPLLTDFDPAPLRYRHDGLTPDRQREYVEAMADCGIAREAARRIGVSEQAVARVRRRADARAFDLACEAAQRIGARRIRSVAYERAIEGTIKRHYYHGELKSEEVVYDNRLLIYLLGKTAHLVESPPEAQAVADNWEAWMEAIEQGLPAPPEPEPEPAEEPAKGDEPEEYYDVDEEDVWEETDGSGWWTRFPPPADYDGVQTDLWGEEGYMRTLTEAEERAAEAARAEARMGQLAPEIARRDWYFGFAGGNYEEDEDGFDGEDEEAAEDEAPEPGAAVAEAEVFSPKEAETNETSEPSAVLSVPAQGEAR